MKFSNLFLPHRILLLLSKMRLLGILVLAVCFLVLVSAKIDTDVTFDDLLKEESNINDKTDSADVEGPKKADDPRKKCPPIFFSLSSSSKPSHRHSKLCQQPLL